MKTIHRVGARPNCTKIAPIVTAIHAHNQPGEPGRPAMVVIPGRVSQSRTPGGQA